MFRPALLSQPLLLSQMVLESLAYSPLNHPTGRNTENILLNDVRCTREIKSRIVTIKSAFNRKKTLFTSKLELNLRRSILWCCSVDTSESRSEIPGKF